MGCKTYWHINSSDMQMRKEDKRALYSWFQVTLFSGFVSYQMVREAYEGRFTVSFLVLSIYIEANPIV